MHTNSLQSTINASRRICLSLLLSQSFIKFKHKDSSNFLGSYVELLFHRHKLVEEVHSTVFTSEIKVSFHL
jgi:hypothetical protein